MPKKYLLYTLLLVLFCIGSKITIAQCPQLLDGNGVFATNPYWTSCSGGNFTLFIQPDINVGNYNIDWGDGSPIDNGASIIPPAFVSHTYAATIDTFIVTFTDIAKACVLTGVVVMERTPTASIEIPVGDPIFACAPASFNFVNNTQNVSQTTNFTWDFGDGSPILTFDETNAGQTISHTYLPGTVDCEVAVILTAENYCNQGNPSISTFSPIQVWDIDDASIGASATLLCYPDTMVDFTNTTDRNCYNQGNVTQRYERWNFGDYWGVGSDSIVDWRPWGPPTNPPITIAYPGLGTYMVELIDSSYCGLDTAYITVQIIPPPTADVDVSKDTICEAEMVTFDNLSGAGANSYSWNYGDGTGWKPSGGGSMNYDYSTAGDYITQLAVFITGGTASCTDTASVPVNVQPSPVASLSLDNSSGCDTLTVSFTDLSSADVVKWNWNFGNGNSSILNNPPSQFYNTSGNYNVQLDVTNSRGCVDDTSRTINVYNSPASDFMAASVCANQEASFIDQSNVALGDTITSWRWNFGDGSPLDTNQNPMHTYTSPGPIDVILTVSTPHCSDADTVPFVVETVPTAVFNPSATNGCSPLSINFTNSSSVSATIFRWDFGDGNTSTATNPSHTYTNNFGFDTTYSVMLIVETAFGCSDTTFQSITVFPKPVAAFSHDAILDCAPLIVNFNNNSTGAVSYLWDFGDGTPIDNSTDPTHSYQNLTQFIDINQATLIVLTSNNCADTAMDDIIVYPQPQFGFSSVPDSGCSPLTVSFPSVIGAVQYDWDFGDGNTSTGPTPTHTYINSTTNDLVYAVELIATSPFGCIDTNYGQVVIFPNPSAQFSADPIIGCPPLPVNFNNNSTGGSAYHWNMGDGTTFDTLVADFGHTFANLTGTQQTYQVSLIAETTRGCTDTAYRDIAVYQDVVALFVADTAGCSPFNVDFFDASIGGANYVWDFGDGSPINTNQNPSHQYVNTGTVDLNFTVTLIVESVFGCLDTIQKNITVYTTPTASFVPNPFTQVFPSATVSYNNTSSPGNWQYSWDFGDTTFSNLENPSDHLYTTWGTYTISLIINDTNCADTAFQTIEITPPLPIADFEGPAQGCRPLDVQFVNNSQYGETYLWDFGDGRTSTRFEPNYTYFDPGIYTVSLRVTGEGGQDVQTRDLIIEVYEVPNAFFTVTPKTVFLPDQLVLFFNLSSDAATYLWDFGDGNTSIEESPQHLYTSPGIYDIILIATSLNSCIDTFSISSAIEAISKGSIEIPNAFTPNPGGPNGGVFTNLDTDNDVFHPLIVGAVEYELSIFNKWGELLFISEDVKIGWDGYYRGELSKQDVYIYEIKVKFVDGRSESYVGDITLLR